MAAKTMIEKFGTWEKVCEFYAEKSKLGDAFFNWMMLQKDYSASAYKEGMFFDLKMLRHCYLIHKKINNQRSGQHHVSVWTGKVGKGKSTGGLQMACLVSPNFDMTYICYTPAQFFQLVTRCKRGDTIVIDEGGRFFGSKKTMTKLGRDMTEAFDIIRGLGLHVIICFPKYHKLDVTIREELVDSIVMKIVNNKSKSKKEKFRYYKAFNSLASVMINDAIKKGKPLSEIKVPPNSTWYGHNSAEIPVLNDLNERAYKINKLRFVRDRFGEWAKEYGADAEDAKQQQDDEFKDKQEYVSISQAKEIVPLSKGTFLNKIHKKELEAKKIGSKYLIKKSSLRELLQNPTKKGKMSD